MLPNKISSIILLTIGIITGIALSVLFNGCDSSSGMANKTNAGKPEVIQKQAADAATKYQRKIDSLKTGSRELEKQLATTRQQLIKARKKNSVLQTQVYDLIDRQGEVKDTLERLSNCDSLEEKVMDLIAVNNEKDSLQQEETQTLEEEIRMKDSTIDTQQDAYQALQKFLDQSLKDQRELLDQNERYKKQAKRQKVKNKLLSIGLIILSGITANYLINH